MGGSGEDDQAQRLAELNLLRLGRFAWESATIAFLPRILRVGMVEVAIREFRHTS